MGDSFTSKFREDPNSLASLPVMAARADTIIVLAPHPVVCLTGILRRRLRYRGGQHSDGVYDRITLQFLRYVLRTGGARSSAAQRGLTTVRCRHADGITGYPLGAPYDRIAAWCAAPRLPRAWTDQLTPGGRIVACLPIAALPSATVIATIVCEAGSLASTTSRSAGTPRALPARSPTC